MKRLLCLFLCGVLLFCGCSQTLPSQKLSVVATIFPAYDFARQMVGDTAHVTMLLPAGGEVHAFEPTLEDIALIKNCDVFIYNGGESDVWVEDLLGVCDMSQKTVIRMMDSVELLVTGEEDHHHDHHHDHQEADEHIWTLPQNALKIAEDIYKGSVAQNPDEQEVYAKNYSVLQKQLTDLEKEYEILHTHTHTPLVVADRFPFFYLTNFYHLHHVAAFSGCSSNTEASLLTVQQLMEEAKKGQSAVILYTEFSDKVLAKTIANGVGGNIRMWHSCHNVSARDFSSGVTYVELMQNNLQILKEALSLETVGM
jgi:zinc transport system substrate-binding protein